MLEEQRVPQLVVVGASAGGIDALSVLVATLPADFPAPLVIAQHLDPGRPSHLAEILARRSTLPVRVVSDSTPSTPLENGVVFVVPSNRHVEITDHAVSLRLGDGRAKPSVDLLMNSAAQVFGESLIAVILTGTGSDGAAGARTVKEAGGMVVIQNPHTARFSGMPAAIAPPLVDVIADIDGIGPLLHDLLIGAYTPTRPGENRTLRTLLDQLHSASGIDFSRYKPATIQRRLQRRMAATGHYKLPDYVQYLESHPEEYGRLVGAFLIKVTEFFRDPELFTYLREQVLPELIANAREHGNELRLWSAGCATGEEAYSLAILVAEALGNELERFTVRIFATDLDGAAVNYARRGVYAANALAALPPELVERHFIPLDGSYEVSVRVRGLVVFGEHDLGQRAPFPRIDLCLCRNVLIYFTPELQRRALQLFTFALRNGGYLALGKAETPGVMDDFFAAVDQQLKVYRRVGDRMLIPATRIKDAMPLRPGSPTGSARPSRVEPPRLRQGLTRLGPTAEDDGELLRSLPIGVVVVNAQYDIQSINGAARRLLRVHGPALGEDLVHLVEHLPAPGLRAAIDAVLAGEGDRSLLLPVETPQGERRHLHLRCTPRARHEQMDEPNEAAAAEPEAPALAVVIITDLTAEETSWQARAEAPAAELRALREANAEQRAALARAEARLQRAVAGNAELEAANERMSAENAGLRSANEEFLIGTEELQAAMEEVETLNEELQATNEELETLNEELQATVEELNTTNDDLESRNLEMQTAVAEREEQRRISEAERARLAAILLSMVDAVLVVGADGAAVPANAAAERLFGLDGSDLVPLDGANNPLPAEETPWARAARGESFSMTFTAAAPPATAAAPSASAGPPAQGPTRFFEATGQPIAAEGELRGGVVVVRDITERSLRVLQNEFLALASHELRTPLTPIRGYLELLARLLASGELDGEAHERARRYVAQMREQSLRLNLLIGELVDASRLQDGRLRLTQETVDLAALLAELVETVQATTERPPLRLSLDGARPLVVRGDPTRLSQVVLNLLTNAVRYAPESPQIEVRLRPENGMAVLEVQDEGPGIPQAAQSRIFDRFYQVERPGSSMGLGVGLFITQGLVQAHGGTVEVNSTEGQGATFTVRLPLLTDAPPAETSASDA